MKTFYALLNPTFLDDVFFLLLVEKTRLYFICEKHDDIKENEEKLMVGKKIWKNRMNEKQQRVNSEVKN
ncbi:CLUMA_CG005780, isoform A [Clunio marinus]|uniref:CLUMA_CG005780, isoform A n=1 Tax=Clunio marinus TaxID=568069 RepID=A0A1J1HXI7_9DIPT|nr:CLUMA_CG005780, isoform A [Clunio marinus]